jgi:hypothetical protein
MLLPLFRRKVGIGWSRAVILDLIQDLLDLRDSGRNSFDRDT